MHTSRGSPGASGESTPGGSRRASSSVHLNKGRSPNLDDISSPSGGSHRGSTSPATPVYQLSRRQSWVLHSSYDVGCAILLLVILL